MLIVQKPDGLGVEAVCESGSPCSDAPVMSAKRQQCEMAVVGPEPSGVPPDTGAERNKGLLNFGRPLQKREIHSAEEHKLHIPEEGRRSSRRGSTRKSAVCPVQRPKTA
ncbi:unnamed protein product [Pleuronectes platessa]|uniref:Uncharacterized protein n=1 Tax=Pleuronectes platessa TaxID=8262 RepID=A0A9N7UV82_PLEPL|nr:unnamed protein product [Pleuronectes platessa]